MDETDNRNYSFFSNLAGGKINLKKEDKIGYDSFLCETIGGGELMFTMGS